MDNEIKNTTTEKPSAGNEKKGGRRRRRRGGKRNRENLSENTAAAEVSAEEITAITEDEDRKSSVIGDYTPQIIEDEDSRTVKTEPEAADGDFTVVAGINFRRAGKIYYFDPEDKNLRLNQRVIVETARGVEIGTVKIPSKRVPSSEIVPPLRTIMRIATTEDLDRDAANKKLEEEARVICKKKIADHGLDMHLVDVEYTFDNSKLIFCFTSEGRVDFRELVKDLASVFKTRIELRQIGIRDETKLMGGLGACGRPYCCSGFLSDFVQVSIKMAKEQNFSLNSAKISGSCGRLMCCLRYEHEAYENALLTTPPVGTAVKTDAGTGVVIETRPLVQTIRVRMDDKPDNIKLFRNDEVSVISSQKQRTVQTPAEENGSDDDNHKEQNVRKDDKITASTAKPKSSGNGKSRRNGKNRRNNKSDENSQTAETEKNTES